MTILEFINTVTVEEFKVFLGTMLIFMSIILGLIISALYFFDRRRKKAYQEYTSRKRHKTGRVLS